VCQDCGLTRHWSPDGKAILLQNRRTVWWVNVPGGKAREFLRHPVAELYSAQFSPDARWVAVGARFKPRDERLFVVPVSNGQSPQDEATWVPVTSGPALDNKPRWSPDGNLLYFVSDRDQYDCVWAQRLDRDTKRPVGAAVAVLHLHDAARSYGRIGSLRLDFSVAANKIVFHLEEIRGNIWMTDLRE